MSIVITVLTALGALACGLIGYILRGLVGDPYFEYREVRKNISRDLVEYANVTSNPQDQTSDRVEEAKSAYRSHSANLRAAANNIPLYRIWAYFKIVPPQNDIETAARNLIGLSNSYSFGSVNYPDLRSEIESALRLRV